MTIIKRPKIKRAIDELWLPPYLQRKPAQPPNFKRFMGHYPCDDCCTPGGVPCTTGCNVGTTPLIMVLTIADLANRSCSDCSDINGTYEVPQLDSDPCAWLLDITGTCDVTAINMRMTSGAVVLDLFNSASPPNNFNRYAFVVTTPADCSVFVDEVLTHSFGNLGTCNYAGATMTFSSG